MHINTPFPILAPRPGGRVTPKTPKPQPVRAHSDSEWAAFYPEIKRLYVHERRKLRFVIQYMESEHAFTATEQMYKKRFAKWGFQKNLKNPAAIIRASNTKDKRPKIITTKVSRKASSPVELGSMPSSPSFNRLDGLKLLLLTSVKTWSMSFFELVQFRDGFLVHPQQQQLLRQLPMGHQPRLSSTREINFTIKLVINLLDQGLGAMAGKMARKAFLLIEDLLLLEGPALVWNLLEMMHHMVTLRHARLFDMLLTHLAALTRERMSDDHPLPTMLRCLRGIVTSLASVSYNPSMSPLPTTPSSSSRSSSSSSIEAIMSFDSSLLSRSLPSVLEQAWVLNAEIVFEHFDYRLFQLYFRILWESCSIGPPVSIVHAADQWIGNTEAQQVLSTTTLTHDTEEPQVGATSVNEDEMVRGLLTPPMNASLPADYEMLRMSSIAELQERGDAILKQWSSFNGDTTMFLRILSGLGTAKLLERLPAASKRSLDTGSATAKVSRLHAANLACVIRTLIELDTHQGDVGKQRDFLGTVKQIRAVVTLCAYAHGETDPQVVQEMLLLQEALVAAGEYEEAREVERDAYRRMESYVQDVPVYFE